MASTPTVSITSTPPASAPDHSTFTITGIAQNADKTPVAGATIVFQDNSSNLAAIKTAADGTFTTDATLPYAGTNSVVAFLLDASGNPIAVSTPSIYNLSKTVVDLDSADGQVVERIFYSLVNHAADPASLTLWDAKIDKNAPKAEKALASSLINSSEYRSQHGRHQSASDFVSALYEAALGRPADAGALSADVHLLQHGLSRQALAVTIANSDEAMAHLSGKVV